MGQRQLAGHTGGREHFAVAGLALPLKLQFQGDHPAFARAGIEVIAHAVLGGAHLGIGALGIAPLHHKRHWIAHHPVEHSAVVGTAPHQVDKIAGREGSGSPINLNLHLAFAGLQGNQGRALEAGNQRSLTALGLGNRLSSTGAKRQGAHQQEGAQQQSEQPHHRPSRGTPRKRARRAPPSSSSARGIGSPTRVRGMSRRPWTRRANLRRGLRPSRTSTLTA